MNGATFLRWFRRLLVVTIAVNAADAITRGFTPMLALSTVLCVVALVAQTHAIRRMDRQRLTQLRPRPDYAAIAAMERDVYGRAFEHDGGPAHATAPRQRWDGRTTHSDTTQPATRTQYLAWLEGYVQRGGKPTDFYDYPFSQARFRYASSPLVVDSGYEYGSSSREIIVARNVTTERTNPAGPFDGWAHTQVFFMHGYRTNKSIIPVYSDPEFAQFRMDGGQP